jgi:hypothetical protein
MHHHNNRGAERLCCRPGHTVVRKPVPDVDQSLRFDYKVGGKDFVLFGSEEMVGDRDWDRE